MFGLINQAGHPVPLKSIDVTVNIKGCLAQVESSLGYRNEEDDPVEATYTFPMDDESAVYHFEAYIDGRHIVAEIQGNEEAVQTYEDAKKHRNTAILLKEDKHIGDTFQCLLGNLPAHSEAQLVIKYIIELPQQYDGKVKFSLPTVLNPRYSPDAGHSIAAELAEYVPSNKIKYRFSLKANVGGYRKVISVTSEKIQLNIQYQQDNKLAKVTLAEEFKFDHDLCFLVEYEEPFLPQVVLEAGDPETEGLLRDDILMVNFYPDLKMVDMATSGEYIFIIDRSGSMNGTKIQEAKVALLLCIKSLPLGCYFNVVSFGSTYSSLFAVSSQQYNSDNLEKALQLQSTITADMGGTEILQPLQHVYLNNCIEGHPRRIIVLTDGLVSNSDQVVGLVRTYASSARLYALGIGEGVSTSFLKGIARAGRGEAVFIADQNRLQPQVISLLKNAFQPYMTDIEIKLELPNGVTPIMIPNDPPREITAGNRMTVFALLHSVDHEVNLTGTVVLNGTLDQESVSYSMTFVLSNTDIDKATPVHRLAIKTQIKLLQDKEADMKQGYEAESECHKIRQRIINLSRCGNIVSKYTAFVAIDTEGTVVKGELLQRSCPVLSLADLGLIVQQGINDPLMDIGGHPRPTPIVEVHDLGMPVREFSPQPRIRANIVMHCTAPPLPSRITNLDKDGFVYTDLKFGQSPKVKGKMDDKKKSPDFYSKFSSSHGVDNTCFYKMSSSTSEKEKESPSVFNYLKKSSDKEECVSKHHLLTKTKKKQMESKMKYPFVDEGLSSAACDIYEDPQPKISSLSKMKNTELGDFTMPRYLQKHAQMKDHFNIHSQLMQTDALSCRPMHYSIDQTIQESEKVKGEFKKTHNKDLHMAIKTTMPSYYEPKRYQGMDALSPEEATLYSRMIQVIDDQRICGNWTMSDQLLLLLTVSRQDLETTNIVKDFDADVVCTLAVITWLRKHFLKHHDEWQMIETKALSWLSAQSLDTPIENLLSKLTNVLWSK